MEERTFRLLEFPRVLQHLSRYAVSQPGRTACLAMRPSLDRAKLEDDNHFLRQAQDNSSFITHLLTVFPDLDEVFGVLAQETKILDAGDLWAVAQVLVQALSARDAFQRLDSDRYPLLQSHARSCLFPERVHHSLKRCLTPEGELRDESSPELLAARMEVRNIQKRCTKKVNDFLQEGVLNPSHLQDEFLTVSSDRYVLALKTNFKGKIQGIIHDYSQTGETCYFEPLFLVELNNRLQELRQEEKNAERKVLAFLTGLCRQEGDALRRAFAWLVGVDVLSAKLRLAEAFHGNFPVMRQDAPIDLRQARHPLLCLVGGDVRPSDIQIREGEKALVISGGNSGGKTVCLKTLGLTMLMCLSGLPVPVAQDSQLPYLTKLFVFLGDEQSLSDNLSTFTAQIEHLRRVWDLVDAGTLVIMDEFGAGTDPSQGAALAQAVLDGLLDREAWIGAATHFPALKAYALAKERVRAASVLFDPKTHKPLYILAYDQVGASLALDVAKEHGLPDTVLKRAQEYLLLDGEDSARLLERLNLLVVQRERELKAIDDERRSLNEEKARLKARYARQAEDLISESRALSQRIVQEWQAGRVNRREAQKQLAENRERLGRICNTDERGAEGLAMESLDIGATVLYPAWGKQGQILEKDEKRQRVKVDLGGVNLWLPVGEFSACKTVHAQPRTSVTVLPDVDMPLLLDLRGQRAEEAGAALERFLDRSLVQGRHRLEIIHGKGTGALREVVHEILKSAPGVQSFHLAPADQGGDGVTLVDL